MSIAIGIALILFGLLGIAVSYAEAVDYRRSLSPSLIWLPLGVGWLSLASGILEISCFDVFAVPITAVLGSYAVCLLAGFLYNLRKGTAGDILVALTLLILVGGALYWQTSVVF